MNQSLMKLLLSTFVPLLLLSFRCASQLSPDFYSLSCPTVELLVRGTVRSASDLDSTIPGKLLRLLFHDCLVQGCDGSVLIQGNGTERSDPANKSLGAFYVVESAKRLLEMVCPGTVSCADTLVLAARDAVELTGGPSVQVQLGRRDGLVSSAANVRPNMVDTTFSVDELADRFASIGLSIDDLVVLSGAHTIGSSHCNTFSERFKQDSDGSLVPIDSTMDQGYAKQVAEQCSTRTGTAAVDNDASTPELFDNQYFVNLLANQGLLHSDSVLVNDSRTKGKVEEFGRSQDAFFASWAQSFAKLSTTGVKTGDEGEIRFSCQSVNG
ncbi:peroxidase 18-like [Zingiber officinale]|uniref:peroxidase 18-like n=1 Tax=Zingiber officinale TaxID=94328 RepID=UPI001C4D9BE5|nr:peroxidase 18-like [Zingiber officinale]